ncbi:hypothetical protein L218DRAFT_955399 [Marasmius fiardii PR-910]|nr:hypothetical protein L218DRAFT_955399 [Marasmius fiardii PR-910]
MAPGPSIDTRYGSAFIGLILSSILYGVTILQTNYPKDPRYIKIMLPSVAAFGQLVWVTGAGIGSAAAADILIAASLCYYLSKSRTGFKRTDSLISTLIIYTLTTGLMTSIIDIIIIIAFTTMPTNYVWLAFFWIVGRCYVNSLLAALNSRDSLRGRVAAREGSFLQLSPLTTGNVMQTTRSGEHQTQGTPYRSFADLHQKPPLAVTIQTDTVYKADYLDSPASGTSAPAVLCRNPDL